MKKEIVRLWNFAAVNPYREKVKQINLLLRAGECTLLCGKDYTGRTLAGIFQKGGSITEGLLSLQNTVVTQLHKKIFERYGIYYIDGETYMMRTLDLAENLFLLKKNSLKKIWVNEKAIHLHTEDIFRHYSLPLKAEQHPDTLGALDKVLMALVWATIQNSKLIVLNNASAGCSEDDTGVIINFLRQLKQEGIALLIYDSHPECFAELADCLILTEQGTIRQKIQDRALFGMYLSKELTGEKNINREQVDKFRIDGEKEEILRWSIVFPRKKMVLSLHRGEILLIQNRNASEQMELWNALTGRSIYEITLEQNGKRIAYRDAGELMQEKIAFWGTEGAYSDLFENLSLKDNMLLPSLKRISHMGFYQRSEKFVMNDTLLAGNLFRDKKQTLPESAHTCSEPEMLQTILYKWKLFHPRVLVLNNIISGEDQEMKEWLVKELRQLADRGTGIILLEMSGKDVGQLADTTLMM